MSEPIHIISDGGGVQSSYLKRLAQSGAFGAKPTAAIFADTKWEPQSVYRWYESERATLNTPHVQVSKGDLAAASMEVRRSKKSGELWIKGLIPAFVKNHDGTKGILGRKCTLDFKINPVRNFCKTLVVGHMKEWKARHKKALAELRGYDEALAFWKKNKHTPPPIFPVAAMAECQADALVILWLGISTDEASRAKPSRVPWIRNEFPLIENNISRSHCAKGVPGAPRSACKFCPFHSDHEWLRLKNDEPAEFESAANYEADLQGAANGVLKGVPYLHASMVSLREVKFNTGPSHQQLDMFNNECEGMCGV